MNKKSETLIFSDVHLEPNAPHNDNYSSFISFLRTIDKQQVDRVICLGDLFDFWFEYIHVCFSSYFEVLRCFAELHEAGIDLHLFCGNHDFWAGQQLQHLTGIQVHHSGGYLQFGSRRAYLFHGDGLNPSDYGYRLFRYIARNKWVQSSFRHIHPDTAMRLAQCLSRKSRVASLSTGETKEATIVRTAAHAMLHEGKADIVIVGHAHWPMIESIELGNKNALYINPGDWPLHRSYVRFVNEEFTLHRFC